MIKKGENIDKERKEKTRVGNRKNIVIIEIVKASDKIRKKKYKERQKGEKESQEGEREREKEYWDREMEKVNAKNKGERKEERCCEGV